MKSELSSPEDASAEPSRSDLGSATGPEDSSASSARVESFPLRIPPILLEGDEPEADALHEDAQKFSLGPVPPAEQLQTEGDLPQAYGTQKLLLTARDPHWLYAHWDLTPEQQREHSARSADGHLALRVHRGEAAGPPLVQVQVHPDARHWFVHVGNAGASYTAELGYPTPDSEWTRISTSAATSTPRNVTSDNTAAEFATIPFEVPLPEMLSQVEAGGDLPLTIAWEKSRGHSPASLSAPPLVEEWTTEQERALAEITGPPRARGLNASSREIPELIQRREELSSQNAPTSPGGISSPLGGWPPRRNFWLNVNAELVIYGATEPDATVTIGGRQIKLRPDGSFSFRFAFPDGEYGLPIAAISADQSEARAAEMKFSRATEFRGEVGAHPQGSELKPPAAQNV